MKSAKAQALYGITDSGSLYEANPISKYTSLVYAQAAGTGMSGANGLAWDESGQRMFYRGTVASSLNLYVWDRASGMQYKIGAGAAAVPTGPVACGTFYNGAYWYVRNQTDTLVRVGFDFTNATAPTVASVKEFANFDGTAQASFSFGDISVRASDGKLFGSSGTGFFSVDIAGLTATSNTTPTNFTSYSSSTTMYQIGFGQDGTLYGETASDGKWFTVDPSTGVATSLGYTSKDSGGAVIAFNDISEAAARGIAPQAAPEPGSLLLLGTGLIGGTGLFTRQRRKRGA